MKLRSDWARVVRSPIPERGEAYIMSGEEFEDGKRRIIVGYDVPKETVDALNEAIEDAEKLQRMVDAVNALLGRSDAADVDGRDQT